MTRQGNAEQYLRDRLGISADELIAEIEANPRLFLIDGGPFTDRLWAPEVVRYAGECLKKGQLKKVIGEN